MFASPEKLKDFFLGAACSTFRCFWLKVFAFHQMSQLACVFRPRKWKSILGNSNYLACRPAQKPV